MHITPEDGWRMYQSKYHMNKDRSNVLNNSLNVNDPFGVHEDFSNFLLDTLLIIKSNFHSLPNKLIEYQITKHN